NPHLPGDGQHELRVPPARTRDPEELTVLDLRALRDAPEAARAALARRRAADALAQFDRVLELDAARRECLARVEQLRAERNEASREFGRRKQAGEDVHALQGELAERAGTLKSLEEDLREFEALLDVHLASV